MTEMIRGYGCVVCQEHHFEGDAEYEPHLGWQSKHGTYLMPLKHHPAQLAYRAAMGERAPAKEERSE